MSRSGRLSLLFLFVSFLLLILDAASYCFFGNGRGCLVRLQASDRSLKQTDQRDRVFNRVGSAPKSISINKAIVDAFAMTDRLEYNMENLKRYLNDNLSGMNQVNVITLMHRCGKRRRDVFAFIDIQSITSRLRLKNGKMTAQGIANALYGMNYMKLSTPGVLSLIRVLSEQLASCREPFEGQALANALYGLRGTNSDSAEVRTLLGALGELLQYQRSLPILVSASNSNSQQVSTSGSSSSSESPSRGTTMRVTMTPQGLGSAFIGLQNMSSEHPEVRLILSILAEAIRGCTNPLDSQALGNILVGLRSSSSEHVEVRAVISALCDHLDHSPIALRTLKPRELSMGLWGMQGMSSDQPEVRRLIDLLCDGLDVHPINGGDMTGEEIGPLLGGLKMLKGNVTEEKRLLRHIAAILAVQGARTTQSTGTTHAQKMHAQRTGSQTQPTHIPAITTDTAIQPQGSENNNSTTTIETEANSTVSEVMEEGSSSGQNISSLSEHSEEHASVECSAAASIVHDPPPQPEQLQQPELQQSQQLQKQQQQEDPPQQQQQLQQLQQPLTRKKANNKDRRHLHSSSLSEGGGGGGGEGIGARLTEEIIANSVMGLQHLRCSTATTDAQAATATDRKNHNDHSDRNDDSGSEIDGVEVKAIINSVAKMVTRYEGFLSGKTVGKALYGLQGMTSDSHEVRYLLRAITRKIDRFAQDYTGLNIAMACYGLQNMVLEDGRKEVEYLLMVLADRIEASQHELTAQNIGMAVYGLKSLSADKPAVRRIVAALAQKMPQPTLPADRQQPASAPGTDHATTTTTTTATSPPSSAPNHGAATLLSTSSSSAVRRGGRNKELRADYSLESIADDAEESSPAGSSTGSRNSLQTAGNPSAVVVAELTPQWHMTGQDIAMALTGLRSMGSEWTQVQAILAPIAALIRGTPHTMSPMELSIALNGLQTMGGGRSIAPTQLQVEQRKLREGNASYLGFGILPIIGLGSGSSSNVFAGDDIPGGGPGGGSRSRKKQRVPEPLVSLLHALSGKLEERKEKLTGPMVASALYGLQGLSGDISAVRRIVRILTQDLSASTAHLDSRNIGNALYGLQNMTTRTKHVPDLLDGLATAIESSSLPLTAQAVGNAFYGLQGMSSERKEVRDVLRALTRKVREMPTPHLQHIYPQSVQPQHREQQGKEVQKEEEVVEVVNDVNRDDATTETKIVIKIDTANAQKRNASENSSSSSSRKIDFSYMMSGQNIGNALWGMRNMTSNYEEVRDALSALATKITQSGAEVNGQNVGNALYSLHAMADDVPEVREVLAALAHKLVLTSQPLSGLDIGMSLYGLRSMESNTPEVRVILGTLIHKIRHSDAQFELRDLCMAMVGLLKATPWIKDDFLSVLAAKTPGMRYLSSDGDNDDLSLSASPTAAAAAAAVVPVTNVSASSGSDQDISISSSNSNSQGSSTDNSKSSSSSSGTGSSIATDSDAGESNGSSSSSSSSSTPVTVRGATNRTPRAAGA